MTLPHRNDSLKTTILLVCWLFSIASIVSLRADSDIEVVSFEVNPRTWVETFAPDQVLFTLRNNGLDDWTQVDGEPPRVLNLHFWTSDDEIDGNDDDQLVRTFTAPLHIAAGSHASFDLLGINRSSLIVPNQADAFRWYLSIRHVRPEARLSAQIEGTRGLLRLTSTPGSTARVEISTDLNTWEIAETFEGTTGKEILEISNVNVRNQLFFRAILD